MPKKRKPRKPMSKEQRAAASERLKKARAARAEKNPDFGLSSVNECLRDLPEDHWRHPKKIKDLCRWFNSAPGRYVFQSYSHSTTPSIPS